MLGHNPMRMDYYKKYQEIIADYNREKDRVTVEETFARLVDLAKSLDAEQRRAAEEGLSDDELALFDLLFKENISKADRERLKQASKTLLVSLVRGFFEEGALDQEILDEIEEEKTKILDMR
jgi:type I restriction enzyme, R subunit